jgi:hypothetical protein
LTVRFYYDPGSGYVADYVTIDNQLPADASNYLVYANWGVTYTHPALRAVNDASNELWIAFAEKAFAQWNETGRAQRPAGLNGFNSYAAIDNGFAAVTFTQILGRPASTYYVLGGTKQTLIDALAANDAVQIGTIQFPQSLAPFHLYAVTAYNSVTDTFTLYNPWGRWDGVWPFSPMSAQVSWNTLLNDCSLFAFAGAVPVRPSDDLDVGLGFDDLTQAAGRAGVAGFVGDSAFSAAVDNVLSHDSSFYRSELPGGSLSVDDLLPRTRC